MVIKIVRNAVSLAILCAGVYMLSSTDLGTQALSSAAELSDNVVTELEDRGVLPRKPITTRVVRGSKKLVKQSLRALFQGLKHIAVKLLDALVAPLAIGATIYILYKFYA